MKGIDISCASQASTAVCLSLTLDQPSSSSSAQLGGRTIDRHNPIIRDLRRTPKSLSLAPCTSQPPPVNPLPYRLLQKSKSCNNAAKGHSNLKLSRKSNAKKEKKSDIKPARDHGKTKEPVTAGKENAIVKKIWGKSVDDLITPAGSSRYLLSEKDLIDYDPVLAVVPYESNPKVHLDSSSSSSSSSCKHSDAPLRPSNQVVVLRVSLHCRGCEGKVRKHISRMEGVRSFNIDFAAKKVTIEGNVTPLGVLASVSKVKSAQFWTPPPISTK